MGVDPNDDLSLAKQYYRQGNYGLAERYFRRAVESGPRDAEAWLGLAASYDRLNASISPIAPMTSCSALSVRHRKS